MQYLCKWEEFFEKILFQTYYAERFHNNYQGGYFQQYILFFTKQTDLTGYSGRFTPAHLWFLLYLFIIALLALPIMIKLKHSKITIISWFNEPIRIMFLFIIPFISSAILDIGGKSLGQFFSFVLIGFLLCKQDEILEMVGKYRLLYLLLSLLFLVLFYIIYYTIGWKSGFSLIAIGFSAFRHFTMWISILAILGYGKKHLTYEIFRRISIMRFMFEIKK